MPDNVGSMNVEYSVAVAEAIKNLEKYNKSIAKNAAIIEKQAKKEKEAKKAQAKIDKTFHRKMTKTAKILKKNFQGVTVAVAGVVASLYGLIKTSSYGSMYTQQFGATLQQLADHIMEEAGITSAIEAFNEEFQKFVDRIDNGEGVVSSLLESLIAFGTWFSEQTGLTQFILILTGLAIAIGAIISGLSLLGITGAAVSKGIAVLSSIVKFLGAKFILAKIALAKIVTWFLAGSAGAIALAVAIGALLGLIVVWLLKKTGVLDWFASLGKGFREWDSWIKDIIMIIASPLTLLGAAILDIVNGNLGFPLLREGFEKVCESLWSLHDKMGELITKAFEWGVNLLANFFKGINEKIKPLTDLIPDAIKSGIIILTGKAFQWGVDLVKKYIAGIKSIPIPIVGNIGNITDKITGNIDDRKNDKYPSKQHGGSIEKTGLNLLHAGEYVVPKAGALVAASGSNNNPIINNIEIINNSASISGKVVDDPANVNVTSIEDIKNNLQSVVDWIQVNVINKGAEWGTLTIANMKKGILSDETFSHIIPNQIVGGIDRLINLSHGLGLSVITEFKGGINELLDDTTAMIPIGMVTGFQQLVESSYLFGEKIAKEIQRGLDSVKLSVTVYKSVVSTGDWGSGNTNSSVSTLSSDSMPGGGDSSFHGYANGGPVQATGLALIHKGEYVVPKGGSLVGSGGDTYNISPVINITNSGSNNDMARQISKEIASEIKRIVKV